MGIERPRSWINSIEEIKALDSVHIEKKKAFELFKKNTVSKDSFESLLLYMHDLGEILYYPDEETLEDLLILKPAWISKQIAKVLDSTEVTENAGFLTKEIMKKIWFDLSPALHEKLITLMEKFDLSYKTKDDKEVSLIVEKLKFEEHESYKKIWDTSEYTNEISFKYQLDTIPSGIPTWFIARTHRFSLKIHWRFGALLQDKEKNNLGLIITSPERKEVWLRVKGASPYYFFTQLRDAFELTLNRFEGLSKIIFVPCPGHSNTPCIQLFELRQLEKRLSITPPKNTIECPETYEQVDVLKMLFGISFAPDNSIIVDRITKEIEKVLKKELSANTQELVKFMQLEFLKSYQKYQEIIDITCPNIFTLNRKENTLLEEKINTIDFELQLFCQMPGHNHSVGDPYIISIPKKWLNYIGPYYNKMIKVLKFTIPLILPGSKAILEDIEFNDIKDIADVIKDYSKILPEFSSTNHALISGNVGDEIPLRFIRKLLDSADPENGWRGLQRLVSPEGHILWVCKEHYKSYKQ